MHQKSTAANGSAKRLVTLIVLLTLSPANLAYAQDEGFTAVHAEVNFSRKLHDWDGFGINYVETAKTLDYAKKPQDYGGFSIMKEADKQRVIDLIFGEDGLKPGLVKMFLDPFHQTTPGGRFDHETTTKNMRYFVREGHRRTRARGGSLSIVTTLYGPPAYVTKQNVVRGRDLDPTRKKDLALYMIDWVKFLRDKEKLPVDYLSLHNEGEDWARWNAAGDGDPPGWGGHDYNLYWSASQVVDFIKLLRPLLDEANLKEVGITNGETSNWVRFSNWGYAAALADDAAAVNNLALITSHGFSHSGPHERWYGDHRSAGNDVVRAQKPGLHSWVTSTSWGKMNVLFLRELHSNIYAAKVNGIIPWAGIQRPLQWEGGDPNPGTAVRIKEDGTFELTKGYYLYKQVSRAGQPGMAVVRTLALDSRILVFGFSSNGTKNPDAFVVVNVDKKEQKEKGKHKVSVELLGSKSNSYRAFRTTEDEENYTDLGNIEVKSNRIVFEAPQASVTTFFANGREANLTVK